MAPSPKLLSLLLATAPLAACGEGGAPPAPAPSEGAGALFVDATPGSGLEGVRHYRGATEDRYLPETSGGGAGIFDYDGDGEFDIYLVNSAPLAQSAPVTETPINRLFGGLGGLRYEDRTLAAGVGDPGFGMGCAIGDVNADGAPDLYVTNWGPNVFYANAADGTFRDASEDAGIADNAWSVSAGFFDPDRDGDLDLYVVNYIIFTEEMQREIYVRSGDKLGAAYPHPDRFDGAHDRLYQNDGNGHFVDVAAETGITNVLPGKGLAVVFSDIDLDGDPDIYVANDSTPNFLFQNDGSGHFEEIAVNAGCAFNQDGVSEASMGLDVGDVDGDGLPDLHMAHLYLETNTLYVQSPSASGPTFRDRTRRAGLVLPTQHVTGFGTLFLDYDSDGKLDIFIANGGLHDTISEFYPDRTYGQRDVLLRGRGDGTFEDVSSRAGPYFQETHVGRGTAAADLDRDGDTDLVVVNSGGPLILLENRATGDNHWLRLRLADAEGEAPGAQGARVRVFAGERVLSGEVSTAESFASASDLELHFGLGPATAVEKIEVTWPSGARETLAGVAANEHYVIEKGAPAPIPARR